MQVTSKLNRFSFMRTFVSIISAILLSSCGGSNWSPSATSTTSAPPLINAMILGFPAGGVPANLPTAMVSVADGTTGADITNATVTVNGVALAYNSANGHKEYEGMVSINPSSIVTLVVTIGGKTYTSTSTQISTYPVLTAPASNATLLAGGMNTIAWTSGAPLAGTSYNLIVADAADPVAVTPFMMPQSSSATSFALTGIWKGNQDVILGLTKTVTIANADPASTLEVGGYSYVRVTTYPIAAPTNVQSISGDSQVTVSWTPDANATSYNIYWSNNAANANKVSGTKIANVTPPYIHTSLNNGATYYYTVTAVSANGEGPESAVVSGAPIAIVNPAVFVSNTQATISWPSLTGVTSYNLYWSSTLANATKLAGNKIAGVTSPYTHTLLTNGTPYYYIVTPVFPSGEGLASPVVRAIPGILMGGSVQGFPLSLTNTVTTVADPFAISSSTVGMTSDGINLYFVDITNNVIKKLDLSTGAISVFAGVFPSNCGSTDGPASLAHFCGPRGITTDGNNLYVADRGAIRKIVIATGIVSTLAGAAVTAGGIPLDGIGSAAIFNSPDSITTDGVNLYVTEMNGYNIRKIVIATATVSTLPTVGSALTTDGANLYISANQTISKMVISTGVISILAGTTGVIGAADGAGALA